MKVLVFAIVVTASICRSLSWAEQLPTDAEKEMQPVLNAEVSTGVVDAGIGPHRTLDLHGPFTEARLRTADVDPKSEPDADASPLFEVERVGFGTYKHNFPLDEADGQQAENDESVPRQAEPEDVYPTPHTAHKRKDDARRAAMLQPHGALPLHQYTTAADLKYSKTAEAMLGAGRRQRSLSSDVSMYEEGSMEEIGDNDEQSASEKTTEFSEEPSRSDAASSCPLGSSSSLRGGGSVGHIDRHAASLGCPYASLTRNVAAIQTIAFLLDNHDKIKRDFQQTTRGLMARTWSENPQVAAALQDHVAQMMSRMSTCANDPAPFLAGRTKLSANKCACVAVRTCDPLFRSLAEHAADLDVQVNNVTKGVEVLERGVDEVSSALLEFHANVVSKMVQDGRKEASKLHTVPMSFAMDDSMKK